MGKVNSSLIKHCKCILPSPHSHSTPLGDFRIKLTWLFLPHVDDTVLREFLKMHTILLNVNFSKKVSQANVHLPPSCPFTGQESEFGRDTKDFECHGGDGHTCFSKFLKTSILH